MKNMKSSTAACIIAAGLFIRLFLEKKSLYKDYYITYIYGYHSLTNDSVLECAELITRGWPLPQDGSCPADLNKLFLKLFLSFYKLLGSSGINLCSTILQLLTAILIDYSFFAKSTGSFSALIFYWLNPIIIVVNNSSIYISLFHMLISLSFYFASRSMFVMLGAIIATLGSASLKYLCVAPIYFHSFLLYSIRTTIFLTFLVFVICVFTTNIVSSFYSTDILDYYFPSTGVLWYANGQVFENFRSYFLLLAAMNPFLYSFPIAVRLKDEKLLAVSLQIIYDQICLLIYINVKFNIFFISYL